jgi:predicted Fe-Mo cluster-binding NifX family protein
MRVAVAATEADLDSVVSRRLGTCPYLLIVDPKTFLFEAIPGPSDRGQPGAGVQMLSLALQREASAVLAKHVSPRIATTLREHGIEVLTGVEGTVREVVERYVNEGAPKASRKDRPAVLAMRKSVRQLSGILPVLLGVVLLIGLFKTFISRDILASVFTGRPVTDTLWGACFGSLLAGHPVNSYVIARALQEHGVSLFAVTAVVYTWVSVGLVQLPAEIAALGRRFAVARNAVTFALSVPVAYLTVLLVRHLL